MRINILYIGILGLIFLSACSSEKKSNISELSPNPSYSIVGNFEYAHRIARNDGSLAFINYEIGEEHDDPNAISIKTHLFPCLPFTPECAKIYSISYSYFQTSCKDSVKNETIVENTNETYTITGEFPGYPCSTHACDTSKYGMDQFKGRYLLCSEHDGKIALIEVNQVTPDPEMAEEIFSTFRWTE